jgi:hypothetical protein
MKQKKTKKRKSINVKKKKLCKVKVEHSYPPTLALTSKGEIPSLKFKANMNKVDK